jgi:hypothetical protein
MADLLFDLSLTILVSILVALGDFIVGWFVIVARTRSEHSRFRKEKHTRDEIDAHWDKREKRYEEYRREGIYWGTEIAAMAFAAYLAIWAVYKENPGIFPVFSVQFKTVSIAASLWLITFVAATVCWLLAITCKHIHRDKLAFLQEDQSSRSPIRKLVQWFQHNTYMILGNFFGMIALFGAIGIIAYA